jgi:peptide/nickel transport system ATP-binding protein/oligopeptide transport system ATP-binding protein
MGLLDSMPTSRGSKRRLDAIPGMVPSPLQWPTGCRFRDRCGRADTRCAEAQPPLVEIAAQHRVACFMAA